MDEHEEDGQPGNAVEKPRPPLTYTDLEDGIRQLPAYSRSLLRIKVPVTVSLAETKLPLSQVTNLAPGSIIQFNKSCDGALRVEIGDQEIAEGEAVKVGDKFGLWITSMSLPDERFWIIHGERSNLRVK